MEISELKPVTKTYTQFELDRMDTPTEVKDILNNYMDFGQVLTVVKSADDEGYVDFKMQYAKDDNSTPIDTTINVSREPHMPAPYLIINDYIKQTTTLIDSAGMFDTRNHRLIHQDGVFLAPVTKKDYPNRCKDYPNEYSN